MTEQFTSYGRCRCCDDRDLLNEDGRCSGCVAVGVTEEWQVDDDEDGMEVIPA